MPEHIRDMWSRLEEVLGHVPRLSSELPEDIYSFLISVDAPASAFEAVELIYLRTRGLPQTAPTLAREIRFLGARGDLAMRLERLLLRQVTVDPISASAPPIPSFSSPPPDETSVANN